MEVLPRDHSHLYCVATVSGKKHLSLSTDFIPRQHDRIFVKIDDSIILKNKSLLFSITTHFILKNISSVENSLHSI